jgi:hypothetical protein
MDSTQTFEVLAKETPPDDFAYYLQAKTLRGRWVNTAFASLDTVTEACKAMQSVALYARVIDTDGKIIVDEDAGDQDAARLSMKTNGS